MTCWRPRSSALFRRLAVFAGGCTLEAARPSATPRRLRLDALDGLASLVDKSLLRQGEPPADQEQAEPADAGGASVGHSGCGRALLERVP